MLKRLNLHKREESNPEDIACGIVQVHRQGNSGQEYQVAGRMLFLRYGIRAYQNTVRIFLKTLDPCGVVNRNARLLRRRQYFNRGPNFVIYVDEYDKLKPFGISIHAAIDKQIMVESYTF
jgi:hypothetical protein